VSPYTAPLTVKVDAPAAPSSVTATASRQGSGERITASWSGVAEATGGYQVQWSTSPTFATVSGSGTTAAGVTTFSTGTIARLTWYVRVRSVNSLGSSAWATSPPVAPAA